MELTGDWEVALFEISIPTDWCNLSSDDHYFLINAFRLDLPNDWYPTIESILSKMTLLINKHHPGEEGVQCFLSEGTSTIM